VEHRELDSQDLAWAVRRLSRVVREMLVKHGPEGLFLAGGFLRASVTGENAADIDLFSPTPAKADEWATALGERTGKGTHRSMNAITVKMKPLVTQFIHRWTFSHPLECLPSFDFTIAQAALWWDGTKWQSACSERFYVDAAAKRLVYTRPTREEAPGGSLLRVLKFYQRGYRIPLDSFAAVIGRLLHGYRAKDLQDAIANGDTAWSTQVLTALLHEVDPVVDPEHLAHLPSAEEAKDQAVNTDASVSGL